jgi:hypothetical protein
VIVAALARSDYIFPVVHSTLTHGGYVIARQIPVSELSAAVQAQVAVSGEQGLVTQWRGVVSVGLDRCVTVTACGNYRIDIDYALAPGAGIDTTAYAVKQRTAGVFDLLQMIQAHRIAIADPIERHPRNIGSQYLMV